MSNLDLLIETTVVQSQLDTGISPALVATRSSLGTRGVAVLAGTGGQTDDQRTRSLKWSREEDVFLQSCLGILSEKDIAEALGRSVIAVQLRWKRDLALPAPTRRPDLMTCEQIANGLGADGKTIALLINREILPGRRLPFTSRVIRVVQRITLLRFLVNPMNWLYFDPHRVGNCLPRRKSKVYDKEFWAYARRLVQRQLMRWKDEWWRIGQVARYHGIHHCAVNKAIHEGRLQATDWGNWWVLKSHATVPRLRLQKWTGKGGKGQYHLDVSPGAEAFLVLAEAVGLTHAEIGLLMKWKGKRVCYYLRLLRRQGRIPDIIEENLLSVCYDGRTGETYADWRIHRDRFPRLARLMESLDTKHRTPQTRSKKRYVHRVQRKAEQSE